MWSWLTQQCAALVQACNVHFQYWVIGGVSAQLFCSVSRYIEVFASIHTNFIVTPRCSEDASLGGAICIQVDIPSNSPKYTPDHQSSGCCCWHSWDSSFGELFFAFWVYCALITLSESIDGLGKLNPNNNNSVVNPSHIGILTSMGAQWSIFGKG
jgi:hypothetical protein